MDRLTVAHEYDPTTGFIVARETVALPPILADSPRLDSAVALAGSDRIVLAFATADRCAPCQQYKRDALNDETVIARLGDARFLPTHIEVDRSPELADAMLGSRGIPMTYALREGKVFAVLRGQRSAAQLLAWLDALARE
ncbi:MAG: thioredoxin family protein [Phycisphaeraceae bacterium]|nr:thioredoxin family protein [Phycisphaeraceae bacterium]